MVLLPKRQKFEYSSKRMDVDEELWQVFFEKCEVAKKLYDKTVDEEIRELLATTP